IRSRISSPRGFRKPDARVRFRVTIATRTPASSAPLLWQTLAVNRRTLVTFHAHPDDESIATGGVMAQAAAAGHRVVLVVATRGEHGEYVDGFLEPGEELGERRVAETMRAAEVLGVSRVEFLGFTDSGMD